MKGKLLFLGTGGSMGIPVIACTCDVCRSSDPKNHRLRPSALITVGGKHFLIDAGPDLRTQALQHKITDLDGVILTHTHHDHTAGLDDLRVFAFYHQKKLPCLLSKSSLEDIRRGYPFFFTKMRKKIGSSSLRCPTILVRFLLKGSYGIMERIFKRKWA